MYYEADYYVENVTQTCDGLTFNVRKHSRRTNRGRNIIRNMPVPDGVALDSGDIVRLKVENHSEESGEPARMWALDRFIGFPYEKERGWEPLDGL